MADEIQEISTCGTELGQVYRLKCFGSIDVDCSIDVRAQSESEAHRAARRQLPNLSGVTWFVSGTDQSISISPDKFDTETELIDGQDIP